MLFIPAQPVADYRERITLDGREYLIRLVYHGRTRRWYLTLSDADGVPIISGRRIVLGYQLLFRVVDPRRPPGDLYCGDLGASGGTSEWDLDQLGTTARLVYLTRDEIEGLKGSPDPAQTVVVS